MANADPSSASGDSNPKQVNPYAAPQIREPESATTNRTDEPVARKYRIVMEWPSRASFLRAAGLLRIAAMAGGVLGVIGLFGILGTFFSTLKFATSDWRNANFAVRAGFVIIRGLVGLYTCWLQWQLADALQATAGGTTSSMARWARLQFRIAVFILIALAIGVLSQVWDWAALRFIAGRGTGL